MYPYLSSSRKIATPMSTPKQTPTTIPAITPPVGLLSVPLMGLLVGLLSVGVADEHVYICDPVATGWQPVTFANPAVGVPLHEATEYPLYVTAPPAQVKLKLSPPADVHPEAYEAVAVAAPWQVVLLAHIEFVIVLAAESLRDRN